MDASTYLNRELSWLEFNRRVLEEARDESVPLLERVKFLAIFSSNLDEFFMVRVARLKRQIRDGIEGIGPDGMTAPETLTAISRRIHVLADEQHLCFLNTILPQLTAEGIHLVRPEEMSGEQERFLEDFFHRTLYPIVTPLAIDPGHPFPYLANRSLCLVVSLRATGVSRLPYAELSIVHIPSQVVPRFIALPAKEGQHAFMLLEDVLRHYLPRLYHGFELLSTHAIRVTRDADFGISRRRDETLLMSIEQGVRERRMGDAVRLQYDPELAKEIVVQLVEELELSPQDLYPGKGFTAFTDLFQLYTAVNFPRLKDRPQVPVSVPAFDRAPDIWNAIRGSDVMVFHPYQSFDAGDALCRGGGKRPQGVGDQDDALSRKSNFPHRSGAGAGSRIRKGSIGARGAPGSVRRRGQYYLGQGIGRSRRPCRLWDGGLQDTLQSLPGGSSGGRWHSALLPSGDRQL